MKRRYIIVTLLLFAGFAANAQNWEWSRTTPSTGKTKVLTIATDNSNNIYATGQINGTTDIGSGSDLNMLGGADIYLAKYNNAGIYQWHKQIAGSAGTDIVSRGMVAVDADDNVVFTAFYAGSITSGLTNIPGSQSGTNDVVLAKFSSTGTQLWAKPVAYGKDADIRSQHVATDPQGNIYVTGVSTAAVYFSAEDSVYHNAGQILNFIAKFDPDGNFVHATKIGYSSSIIDINRNKFVEIEATREDAIYVGGFFTGSVYAGADTLYAGSTTKTNALVLKIDGAGDVTWARMAGDPLQDDRCNGVSTDDVGSVYITGYITGSAVFDSTDAGSQNSSPLLSNGANSDIMVAKYNPNGRLRWKKRNGDTGKDQGYGAYISENLVMFTGYYSGTVTFNNVTLSSTGTTDYNTGFFVYDTDGNPITAQEILGSGDDRSESIEYDQDGKTYIAGYFKSTDFTIGSDVYDWGSTQEGFIAVYQNPFSATFSEVEHVSCYGGNDGKLEVTPYFGSGDYEYEWSGNATNTVNNTAYDLAAGTYSVTVTDTRGPTTIIDYEITQATEIDISFTPTHVSCYQGENGEIDVTVTGGTGEGTYDYNWSGGTGLVPLDEDQTGLGAGWFNLLVKDGNECEMLSSIELTQPPKILFGTSVVIPTSGSSGEIDANITGGTPDFNYTWYREGVEMGGETTDSISSLDGATYQLSITDANACPADTAFVVPDAALLQINKYMTQPACYGESNGTAAVELLNKDGANTYTYEWSTTSADTNITDIAAGTYYITITEDGGSNRTLEDSVIVTQPAQLVINSIIPTDVACYGDETGVITVDVEGGTPDLTFEWSNGDETESISLLPVGDYDVTVTDANECFVTSSASVSQSDSITITFNEGASQSISCFGLDDGSLVITASDGSGGFSYQWDDKGDQTSYVAANLVEGVYTIEVTDALGCKNSKTYNLSQPDSLRITIIDTANMTCYTSSDGRIVVQPTGGTEPFSYSWSHDARVNSRVIEELPAFNYSLTVTDDHSCVNGGFSFRVKRPSEALDIDHVIATMVHNQCFGGSEGELEFEATGGWGEYEYSINDIDYQTNPVFTGLTADDYTGYVRDAGGCVENHIPVEIEETDELDFNYFILISNDISTEGIGGTEPYTYFLNGEEIELSQLQGLPNGTYTVSVDDANGCGPVSRTNVVISTTLNDYTGNIAGIYPNPSEGIFTIQFAEESSEEYLIEVFSASGELILNQNLPAQIKAYSLDLSQAEAGIYLLKVNGLFIGNKLIVQ